jgi:hypothetical protein
MGRHGSDTGGPRWSTAAAVLVALVIVVAGGASGWAWHNQNGRAADRAGAPSSTRTTTTTSPTPSPSTTSTSVAEEQARATAQKALAACAAEVKAGQAVAAKAAVSAAHWATHTGAQLKFDSGAYTLAQTKAAWAASKATGAQDVRQFAAADRAYRAVDGKCGTVAATADGTDLAPQAVACAARGTALAQLDKTGAVVNGQWAAHLDMMANKAHYVAIAYRAKWDGMVRAAQPAIAAYRAAVSILGQAPACAP